MQHKRVRIASKNEENEVEMYPPPVSTDRKGVRTIGVLAHFCLYDCLTGGGVPGAWCWDTRSKWL